MPIEIPGSLAARLHRESGGEKFGLSAQMFTVILQEIAAKYLPSAARPGEIVEFLTHLRVEELALARACAQGSETAWVSFLNRYREKLYSAAHSFAPDDASARELADSLYAELYGIRSADGRRISKLDSFTGRGSLEGWLRAVLAQEHVNRFRRQNRWVSLDEQVEAGAQFESASNDPAQEMDPRLIEATDQSLAALSPEDKFILVNYYLDNRTLAEIARLQAVHESTISRRLEKITASLRKAILSALMQRGMSRREAQQTMEADIADLAVDVRGRLMRSGPA
jgi:RNA polymerase sigma-70 factor, ECF subfamily